ncbi:PC4-domain-containing protein [Marasmius fiardii PR-910]|nr:PC4-domain-containing protein [Marasmius fiardii PR-910]
MAKRKAHSEEEEEFEESDASRQASPPHKKKSVKKSKPVEDDSEDQEDRHVAKGKAKKSPASRGTAVSTSGNDLVQVHKNADGNSYIDLGKKKRATVRTFKNKPLVDIREFYGDNGDEKPGKKGISLTDEQWDVLKKSVPIIDRLFKEQTES